MFARLVVWGACWSVCAVLQMAKVPGTMAGPQHVAQQLKPQDPVPCFVRR